MLFPATGNRLFEQSFRSARYHCLIERLLSDETVMYWYLSHLEISKNSFVQDRERKKWSTCSILHYSYSYWGESLCTVYFPTREKVILKLKLATFWLEFWLETKGTTRSKPKPNNSIKSLQTRQKKKGEPATRLNPGKNNIRRHATEPEPDTFQTSNRNS